MKSLKPEILLAFIGGLVAILAFSFDLISFHLVRNTYITAAILSLFLGSITFLLLYFGIKLFIQNRLNNIYKNIQNPPVIKANRLGNLIDEAEEQVSEISKSRTNEIQFLRSQEQFRKEFIGNLAHELKTPVFSIQGYIDTLLEGALDDPKTAKNFLQRASKSSDRMIQLIEDLDAISSLESPELVLEMRPFDLIEVIKEVYEDLEIYAKEKNIQLVLKKDYSPAYVIGDRNKINQVITNLVKNSIVYGHKDGKTEMSINNVDEIVLIEIKDNGIGIDPKHWPRLFERFYRVEQSRNRHEGGTGLGLAIVKHIIEMHGQNITMRSTLGVGTTFTFGLERSSKNLQLSSRGIPIK
jgi:two-component system phosphate regulon sensor histidine kinase PhoR